MAWPQPVLDIRDEMQAHGQWVWNTAPDIAHMMGWSVGKTYYWLDYMVKNYWLIWRWHPKRHGWHATRQYALPWLAKGKEHRE